MVYLLVLLAGLLFAVPASAQCIGALQSGSNLSDVCSASTARTNLGLGSIATQAANSVAITGGAASGLTSLGMTSTGAFLGASGTTAQRPAATAGGFRFNSSTGLPEYANGSSWTSFGTGGTVTSVATGAGLTGGTITSTGTVAATTNTLTNAFKWELDGAGSAITAALCTFTGSDGAMCIQRAPFACTITRADLYGGGLTGSAVIEVAKYTSYTPGTHPVSGDKITASAPPTISSATQSADSTLTGWTTSVSAGDWIAISITSISTFKRLNLDLTCVKS